MFDREVRSIDGEETVVETVAGSIPIDVTDLKIYLKIC